METKLSNLKIKGKKSQNKKHKFKRKKNYSKTKILKIPSF